MRMYGYHRAIYEAIADADVQLAREASAAGGASGAQVRVEGVADAVADQVEGQRGQHNRCAREDHCPRRVESVGQVSVLK
jgi:hypothetical protein